MIGIAKITIDSLWKKSKKFLEKSMPKNVDKLIQIDNSEFMRQPLHASHTTQRKNKCNS